MKEEKEKTLAAQFGFTKGCVVVMVIEIQDELEIVKYMESSTGYAELLPGIKVLKIGHLSKTGGSQARLDEQKKQLLRKVESAYDQAVAGIDTAIIDATIEQATGGEYHSAQIGLGGLNWAI